MDYKDVVVGRRSIRGYQDKPVPKALIREVLEMAMRAPTSLNTQPWNFYVVTGEPLSHQPFVDHLHAKFDELYGL